MMKIILAFAACLVAINAEKCVPGIVPEIQLFPNNTLAWTHPIIFPDCNLTAYLVTIYDYEEDTIQQFTYKKNLQKDVLLMFDVSFLEICTVYGFQVQALTKEGVVSAPNKLDFATHAPEKLDYTLYFEGHTFNNSEFTLSWNFNEPRAKKCVSYYRVVHWSDEHEIPTDVYVTTNQFTMSGNIRPCMPYNFHVNAIVDNPDHEGVFADYDWEGFQVVSDPPELVNVNSRETSVVLTFKVPTYSENRCKLEALVLTNVGKPGAVVEPIIDSEARPNVELYLDGLKPNTVYSSKVLLRNCAGDSKNVTITYDTAVTSKLEKHVCLVSDPPELVNVNSSETSVVLTFKVPTYSENPCKLKALVLTNVGKPGAVVEPIIDSEARPNVELYLDGLKPNRVYSSQVLLTNCAGDSKNVTITYDTAVISDSEKHVSFE